MVAEGTTEFKRCLAVIQWAISQGLYAVNFQDIPPDVVATIKADFPYTAEEILHINPHAALVFQP